MASRGCSSTFGSLVLLISVFFPSNGAGAAETEWPATFIPPEAIGFYRFDPTGFEPGALSALPLALEVIEESGLVEPAMHPVVDAITAAAVAGTTPHTLCILDLDAVFDEQTPRGFRVERLRAVLLLDAPRGPRGRLDTLASILAHYGEESEDHRQQPFTLPNGEAAMRFRAADWNEWQTVEWAVVGESVLIGLGPGGLAEWIEAQREASDQEFIERHRHRTGRNSATRPFLEAWVNLERLHETMPDVLARGRVRRWLVTWKLDNARDWMLHGRWGGRYLLFDVSWRRRSDPADVVSIRRLSLDHWPPDAGAPPPDGFLAVFPADLNAAFDRAARAWRSLRSEEADRDMEMTWRKYEARRARLYDLMWQSFLPYVLMTGDPAPPAPIPGALTLRLALRAGESQPRAAQRMKSLVELFSAAPGEAAPVRPRVERDRRQDIAWIGWDDRGLLRGPAWGWADRQFLLTWGPGAVLSARGQAEPGR